MALGDAFTETTPGSASKLNTTNVIWGTGTYLSTLDKTKHKVLVCTSTGSGFTVDHVYLCSADGTTALDISDIDDHTHTTAGDGGSALDIYFNNTKSVDTGNTLLMDVKKGFYFNQGSSGTTTHTDTTDGTTGEHYIETDTGATNGSTGQHFLPVNLQIDFTEHSKFSAKHKIQTASSLALKCGIGMESLASSDDNDRKYGAEICTTVNNNWFAASANGTTRSSSDTGTAMTTTKRPIICHAFPETPKIDLYIEDQNAFTKTTNIPTSNSTNQPSRGAFFRYSVKNNTGSSRKFNWYGARIVYEVSDDTDWF